MKKNCLIKQKGLLFRKFSRKKFAAFNSLGKTIKISALGVACSLIASPVQSQSKSEADSISTKVDLEEVEVVGQKSTVLIDEIPRIVEIIDAQTIQNSPSQSFQDLIQYSSNIDISQRGQFGIQSDVSIRGGSFDQVLVLQNGINLTDPQTGHHNFNLPVDRESISKIEILNGPASRALGANAFSGAINIITKPQDKNEVSASINAGEYGYYRGHLGVNLKTKNTRQLFSGSYSTSNGYTYNTDFLAVNFNYHGEYDLPGNIKAFTLFGINNKAFGANSYYHPKYSEQFEETSAMYFSAGLRTGSIIKIKPEIYWRRHIDRFELFREGKDYYRLENNMTISNNAEETLYDTITWYTGHNYHLSDIFGANINTSYSSKIGTTSLGAAIRSENIISNTLGRDIANPIPISGTNSVYYNKQDFRNSFDISVEQAYQSEKIFISAGALLHWNSFDPQKLNFLPGIDLSYSPIKYLSVVGSYNYTIGHPTFTDIWYKGPANIGNADLRPYFQHSYEIGLKAKPRKFQAGILAFYTQGHNNINWVLDGTNPANPTFKARNTELSENIGIESSLRFKSNGKGISNVLLHEVYIGYTFIDTYRSNPDSISKYTNIKHKAVARLDQQIMKRLLLSWNLMYKQRIGTYLGYNFETAEYTYNPYPDIVLIDIRATYSLKNFQMYAEVSNLLDRVYVESGSIAQPGRLFNAGVSYRFDF
jgi:vitamin B12 transporter